MLGWLAERRKERSGVRFSQPPKGTDTGPNVQIFFYFFRFGNQDDQRGRTVFFVAPNRSNHPTNGGVRAVGRPRLSHTNVSKVYTRYF